MSSWKGLFAVGLVWLAAGGTFLALATTGHVQGQWLFLAATQLVVGVVTVLRALRARRLGTGSRGDALSER